MNVNPTEEFCFVSRYSLGLFPFFLFLTRIGLGVDLIGTELQVTETLTGNFSRKYLKQSNRMFRSRGERWSHNHQCGAPQNNMVEPSCPWSCSLGCIKNLGNREVPVFGTVGSINTTTEVLSGAQ